MKHTVDGIEFVAEFAIDYTTAISGRVKHWECQQNVVFISQRMTWFIVHILPVLVNILVKGFKNETILPFKNFDFAIVNNFVEFVQYQKIKDVWASVKLCVEIMVGSKFWA